MNHIKYQLRQQISQARLDLPSQIKEVVALQLCKFVINLPIFKQAQDIAFYWPYKAEIDTTRIIDTALTLQKSCYLPVLHPNKDRQLLFLPYNTAAILQPNKYGILEPIHNYEQAISIEKLAIIFLPLVAFDLHGYRLGMGGGYYDATLANITQLTSRPLLIGLAYSMQKVDLLPRDSWDLKLDGVLTETGYYTF